MQTGAGGPPSPAANGEARGLILVVEDDLPTNRLLTYMLGSRYRAVAATNGQEGLQRALELEPDLIITDLAMPVMDGEALLHEVRRSPVLREVPVLVLTGTEDQEVRLRLLRTGAQDYLTKPCRVEELLVRTGNLVQMHQARSMLLRRTADLETAMSELESFSYSVSHDLRAPLRSIKGFAQALAEDYGSLLPDQGTDFLRRISRASERMSDLIDALLSLARIARTDLQRQSVDLSKLAEGLGAELSEGEPGRHVRFSVAPGLTAEGDLSLLRLALQNLLSNSWKFTNRRPEPWVEFGAVQGSCPPCFYVRDNGIGFEMAAAVHLFRPFVRLHRPGEYEGSGVGLATVQRVVRRHGGRIWAESQAGEGTVFYFTLSPQGGAMDGLAVIE